MNIYIDFDGTIAKPDHDNMFLSKIKAEGFESAVKWYDSTYIDNLPLNIALLEELKVQKAAGYTLILWTNRGKNQIEMTHANLGEFDSLFDSFEFYEGKKKNARVSGIVYDNEERYRACVVEGEFRLITF